MADAPTTEEVRAALAQAERDDRRASRWYSSGPDTAPGYEMALEVAEHRDALAAALAKIDAIRNSIIGRQGVNWSAHIYPLVAALDEAGYGGEGYEVARPKAEAERAANAAVFADRDALAAEVARLREALEKRYSAGHNDTCAAMLGDYACSCGHDGRRGAGSAATASTCPAGLRASRSR